MQTLTMQRHMHKDLILLAHIASALGALGVEVLQDRLGAVTPLTITGVRIVSTLRTEAIWPDQVSTPLPSKCIWL